MRVYLWGFRAVFFTRKCLSGDGSSMQTAVYFTSTISSNIGIKYERTFSRESVERFVFS